MPRFREAEYRYAAAGEHNNDPLPPSHRNNRHPLDKEARAALTKLGAEYAYWLREERRKRRSGGEFWIALENQERVLRELRRVGARPGSVAP